MAGITTLRDAAREAIFSCGGRGFVRFLAEGDALLVSDAVRRVYAPEQREAMIEALFKAGFSCEERAQLLMITPTDERLLALCDMQPDHVHVQWSGEYFDAEALAARFLREEASALDEGGRQLALCAARLLWQPEKKVIHGLSQLRAMAAIRLREGKRSGLYETGRLLAGWLSER